MIELLDALGSSILRALVSIRAGLIIASAAFLEMSIAAANASERGNGFLRTFFVILTVLFGLLSAVVAVVFVFGQLRSIPNRPVRPDL